MIQEQETEDLLEKFERFRNKRALAHSIRKRGEDEIEIRLSTFDGYIRGFIRAVLLGIFCVESFYTLPYGEPPFNSQIETIKEDFMWAFKPDERIKNQYQRHIETVTDPEFIEMFPNHKGVDPYEEYKQYYLKERRLNRIRAYFHFIWPPVLLFFIFLPRRNGIRVNRKKRLIYWQGMFKQFSVAYVPEEGDPLGGVVYSRFGIYALGGFNHFSLKIQIKDFVSGLKAYHYAGVYPTPHEGHNADIVRAIRAYLQEDNPAFLQHIGNRYRTIGFYPMITFCNFAALPCRFNRKKAKQVLDNAEQLWRKKNANQKNAWFAQVKAAQKSVNKDLISQGLDNHID